MPVEIDAPAHNRFFFTRARVIHESLDTLDAPVAALEVGRLRDPRETRGHSTLHIAAHPRVARLVSIDIAPETEAVCLRFLPAALLARIEFVNMDAVTWLRGHARGKFQFFYLDGLNEAGHCRAVLEACLPVAAPGALFVLDDTDRPDVAHKGDLVLPYIAQRPELFAVVCSVPHDAYCHGETVLKLKE